MDGTRRAPHVHAWWPWAVAALLPWAWFVARFRFTCDDAYISFRYARNLADGHGLVFNIGEAPPVEGYSNFAWVLLAALAQRLGLDPALVADVVSIAAGGATLLLVARFAAVRLALDRARVATVLVFTGLLPPLAVWSTSGLETMAFTLCTFLAFERLALDPSRPRAVQAGCAALAAALLRADGAAWSALALALGAGACRLAPLRSQVDLRVVRRALITAFAILVVGVAAHLAWRQWWHASWVPNTARVKAGVSALRLERGWRYVASFALAVPVAWLVPLAAGFVARDARKLALLVAMPLAVACVYATWTGGDFMPFGRFIVVALPFVGIACALVLRALPLRAAWTFALVACAAAPLASFGVQPTPTALHFRWNDPRVQTELSMWRGMRERAREWSTTGRALARVARPDESIVLGNVGAIGYFSGLRVFDLFGLISPDVAASAAPDQRASPGHDRRVEPEFFAHERPTYLAAWTAPIGSAHGVLPTAWQRALARGDVRYEAHPIDAEARDGSAATVAAPLELRLLRYVRTQ